MGRGSPDRARGSKPLQRALHALQIANPLLDDVDLLSGFPLDDIAGSAVSDAQGEQLLDLLQRETEILSVFNEPKPRDGLLGVLAVAGGCALRPRRS